MLTNPPPAPITLATAYPPGDYRLVPQQVTAVQLMQMLQDADSEAASHPESPTYLFRGQGRRRTTRWPPERLRVQGHTVRADSYELDLLLPTFARGLWSLAREGQRNELNVREAYSTGLYALRARLIMYATFLRARAARMSNDELELWLGAGQGHSWDKLVSVGQHTGTLPPTFWMRHRVRR
jgi:hypothetical protein